MGNKEQQINDKIRMRTYQSTANISIFAMAIVAAIEIMMLGLTVLNKPLYGTFLRRYRMFYIALLLLVLIYIGITVYVKGDFPKRFRILNIVNPISTVFFFVWSIGTTYNDFLVLGTVDPTVFMTFSLTIPLCFYLTPAVYSVMAIAADIAMVYITLQAPNGIGLVINMIIFCVFQLALGVSLLHVKKNLSGEIITTEHQKDEIEKLSSAQSLFFSSVSHEIRTPINAVLGMDEMILRESKEDSTIEYARNIKTAGTTLLSLINDILDFSKIGAGKMEIVPTRYQTADLFHDLVVMIETRAKDKGLTLTTKVDENIPVALYGDEVRIKQVVTNLLSNAVKYTEKGSVTLEAHCEKVDAEHVDLFMSVKDTGIGIREEDVKKLFSAFERIDEKRNRNVEGTGLGMSIAANLLDMMGSKIQVSSEYGKGSEFSFVLRQKVEAWEPIGDYMSKWQASVHKHSKPEVSFAAPQARVLVVDDDPMNLKLVKKLFGLFQITPKLLSSGSDAVNCLRKEQFDIVFMDHLMPGMDGIETFRKIKEEKLLPENTKVIALTAMSGEGVEDTYFAEGFDDYLSKPMNVGSLEAMLKKWLPESNI